MVALVCAATIGLAACTGSPLAAPATTPAATGPASQPGQGAWTTPPAAGETYSARPAQPSALQPAPRTLSEQPAQQPGTWTGAGQPPPPPPPDQSIPVVGVPGASPPSAVCPPDPCAPQPTGRTQFVVPPRTYAGCWPPCNDGISSWHVRGVIGRSFYSGTDPGEDCNYYGADIGRTFCGCWGLDAYYRYNSGRFDRTPAPGMGFKDGGSWHHFGAKVTKDFSFGRSSRLYAWVGLGAGYFTTDEYINNDSGFEIFGEAGLGYNLSRNWRVRAGVNVHGMDTSVTRELPINDGTSRWLWIFAPVAEIEGSF